VNIATEIPQTTTAYGHSLSRYGSDADIDRSEVERNAGHRCEDGGSPEVLP